MMGESHIVDKKLKKSMQLLGKYLEKKDCETFLSGEPLSLIINHELYMLHKLDDSTVEIKQEGRANPGYIRQGTLPNLYDSVVAFITNVEYAGVDWGCGSMSLKLPDAMPPRDLSFYTYALESSPGIINAFKTMLKIVAGILVFPYYIGLLIADVGESTFGFIVTTIMCAVICGLIAFFIANPTPGDGLFDFNLFMMVSTYLILPGYIGALSGRYQKWKAKWEVKQE